MNYEKVIKRFSTMLFLHLRYGNNLLLINRISRINKKLKYERLTRFPEFSDTKFTE
jgi:hypothetical protein